MTEIKKKHWQLYVLKLEQNKWYVGITSLTPEKRFSQHWSGFGGANWTRKYKPIKIYYTKDLGCCSIKRAERYESRVTRMYMRKYGWNNVRGGDLADTEDYILRFGRFYTKDGWFMVKFAIVFMLLLAALLALTYYMIYDSLVAAILVLVGCGIVIVIEGILNKISENKKDKKYHSQIDNEEI